MGFSENPVSPTSNFRGWDFLKKQKVLGGWDFPTLTGLKSQSHPDRPKVLTGRLKRRTDQGLSGPHAGKEQERKIMKIEELEQAVKKQMDNCSKRDSVCMGCPFNDEWGDSCALMEDLPDEWEIPE